MKVDTLTSVGFATFGISHLIFRTSRVKRGAPVGAPRTTALGFVALLGYAVFGVLATFGGKD